MHSDAQRNQHKVKTDQSKAKQSKIGRGTNQNRTGEKRPETSNDPILAFSDSDNNTFDPGTFGLERVHEIVFAAMSVCMTVVVAMFIFATLVAASP